MAKIELLAPILFKWEAGYQCMKEDKGNYNSKGVLVGTNKGVTANAYESLFKVCPTVEDMKNLTDEKASIVLRKYWNAWKADDITNQSVANILVDFYYNSGSWGIKIPQRVIGVIDDGVVGNKTISALNSQDQKILFEKIFNARIEFVKNIIKNNPTQSRFLRGWINRITDFKFSY